MASITWVYKHYEVGKVLTGTLSHAGGLINLDDYTVTFTARRTLGSAPVIGDEPLTVTGLGAIQWAVTVAASDPDTVPENLSGYLLEFKITSNINNSVRFFPEDIDDEQTYGRLVVQRSLA